MKNYYSNLRVCKVNIEVSMQSKNRSNLVYAEYTENMEVSGAKNNSDYTFEADYIFTYLGTKVSNVTRNQTTYRKWKYLVLWMWHASIKGLDRNIIIIM